jgi:nucleotide-binding universal stress UspA family protein
MTEVSDRRSVSAAEDFRQARRRAAMQELMARLTGQAVDLLSFEEVRQKLKLRPGAQHGRREIPVAAIVGSVGRYQDFTRSFLPRKDSDLDRWARVEAAMAGMATLPPIDVYQIDQVYFVLDGNHRVSAARQLGITHIEAYVTEFKTDVPFTPDDRLDDLLIKAEYAEFLRVTHFTDIRPDADLRVTAPGRYWQLETHIEAHRYLLGQDASREISVKEAAAHWYDRVYLTIIQLIREQGILRDFPERTETDLFLWIFHHRASLEKQLGWRIEPDAAAADLAAEHSSRPNRVMARVEDRLLRAFTPDSLSAGPPPGQWRQERLAARHDERLFADILVPVSGESGGWQALDLALAVAQREGSQMLGLHIVSSADQKESEPAQAVKAEFERRCQIAGVSGNLVIDVGHIVRQIYERARWADLVVIYPANPPGAKLLSRLSSGSRTVIYRSCRPVLTVPGPASAPQRVLLAYDGSPKAREALFIAAYLTSQWQVSLGVVNVIEADNQPDRLAEAQSYLETHGLPATFISTRGDVAGAILATAADQDCDLLIMGGYAARPIREVVLGSTVDQLLRESQRPILICR